MKHSLQLRFGQQLTMTPQLQQAIKLLQLSTLDLQYEIQQALDSNMMLEVKEEEASSLEEVEQQTANTTETTDQITSEGSQTEIPDELPIDTSWDDVYENIQVSTVNSAEPQEFEMQRSKSETLQDHLLWQLELASISERDHAIAMAILDSINEEGYLVSGLDEIYNGLLDQLNDLEQDEVEAVLHRVQNFDPPGVAAVDLGDCLKRQLQQLPETLPYRKDALELVTRHLDLLASQERAKLMRQLGLSERQLGGVIDLIRSLDPRPGNQLQNVDSDAFGR